MLTLLGLLVPVPSRTPPTCWVPRTGPGPLSPSARTGGPGFSSARCRGPSARPGGELAGSPGRRLGV
eukprot:11887005-Heterocapsa_arctica.AAC.2